MELMARFHSSARATPERIAYVAPGGERVTYGALAGLIGRVRIASRRFPGGAIVLHAGNCLGFVSCLLGAMSAGLSVLVLAESTTAAEVRCFARRVAAKAIITSTPARFDVADTVLPISFARESESASATDVDRFGDLLLTSSGSTGVPKIVRRDAASLDAVAANMVEAIGFKAEDCVLAAVPLAHSYGIEHGLLAPLWAGSSVALFEGLDLDAIAATSAPLTIFPAVPSMLERLVEVGNASATIAKLRTIYSAGAALPDSIRARFAARYGRNVGQLFGATEIGTVAYRSGDARPGDDVGWPMTGVSVQIRDSGELAIRSPSMFRGYVDDDEAFDPLVDGHFLTGDLGRLTSDGALLLEGRRKLLIDVGGLKVNPAEVEAVLSEHADVTECVVLALPQSETVSRLRAIVVRRDGTSLSTETLRHHARRLLAPHKVPRIFEIRATPLPRSATGKLLRTKIDEP